MRKIFNLLFLFFILFIWNNKVFWDNSLNIISRSQWWSIEEYRYSDSIEWKNIILDTNKILKEENNYISDDETINYLWKPDYNEKIENYLSTFFWNNRVVENIISEENNRKLFWPIAHSKDIKGIIIHHTAWDYTDAYDSIREIYKFHTLNRMWWDIWYNFLIANDWTIFEWRAWWEKAVWAHTKRNNIWNIGISLMWNYEHDHIPEKQLEALNNLTEYIINKYDIDINKKRYFHEDCLQEICEHDIKSYQDFPIIAHRDSSSSSCPWETGYQDFLKYRSEIIKNHSEKNINVNINEIKFYKIFEKYSQKKLEYLYNLLVVKKQLENNNKRKIIYSDVLIILKKYMEEKYK